MPARHRATLPPSTLYRVAVSSHPPYRRLHPDLGNYYRVTGLEYDILRHIPALDHIFVVEINLLLLAISIGAQDVNLLLFGEVTEPATKRNSVQDGDGMGQRVITWLRYIAHDVIAETVHAHHNDCNLGVGQDLR